MVTHRIRHLPVVDRYQRVVGMISSRDVLAHQVAEAKAMGAAAEQVAMLSTELKTLDFDEVVGVVTRHVPRVFGAECSVIFFPGKRARTDKPLLVSRNRCPRTDRSLSMRRDVQDARRCGGVATGPVRSACRKVVGKCNRVVLPLEMRGPGEGGGPSSRRSRGFLCMCGLDDSAVEMREILLYKASLVREIIGSNLTSAARYQGARNDSLTDTLTSVGSRRLFDERFENEVDRSKRYRRKFSVAMLDIDHFKSINDGMGHSQGDEALCMFAQCLQGQRRSSDVLARYGGDEFVMLMPETGRKGAVRFLERIRKRIEALRMPNGANVTVSCGVVEYAPGSKTPTNELIRRADMAMYEAKRAGRNRVKTWQDVSGDSETGRRIDNSKIEELQSRVAEISMKSKEMFIQSLWGLIQAIEARDKYTRSHSENVMRYAVAIAETMGIEAAEVNVIRRAAMIHDVGKIGVPDSILGKPTRLTAGERRIMEHHPVIGVQILDQMQSLERELPLVRHHHERWNGTGYPDRLAGERIPLGARVLAAADSFDAITSDRVYRKSESVERATSILKEGAGNQFDPHVVTVMLAWIDKTSRRIKGKAVVTPRDLLGSQDWRVMAA